MRRIIVRATQWYHGGAMATVLAPARVFEIDTLVYLVSALSLLFTSDQLRIIWVEHRVSGLSMISWFWYSLAALVWLMYGISRKDRVIIITNALWFVAGTLVVVGIAMYR